ncbi:transposase [Streptosporangium vulgare]|uniref:Transposase n=1 Tax=Streptosporangium vulgare TaxID=46190 RepID=A0ABV5T8Q2_9ACTN
MLSGIERKTGWSLAEYAGEATPGGMQRLLTTAKWDVDGVHDDIRTHVIDHLGATDGVLIGDDTCFEKKGAYSAGVQRQYVGTRGRSPTVRSGYSSVKPHPADTLWWTGDSTWGRPEYARNTPRHSIPAGCRHHVRPCCSGHVPDNVPGSRGGRFHAAAGQRQHDVGDVRGNGLLSGTSPRSTAPFRRTPAAPRGERRTSAGWAPS